MTSEDKSEVFDRHGVFADAAIGMLVELIRLETEPAASHAAKEIARRFSPLIRSYWYSKRCGEYDDFSQEVLTRLFVALPHLREAEAFPGLFRQIVVRAAADYWRRFQPLGEDVPEEELEEIADPAGDFSEELVTKLFVLSYLDKLPPRERQILWMLYYEDLDPVEIANLLSISQGAVRTTKVRALTRLREALKKM